MINAANL